MSYNMDLLKSECDNLNIILNDKQEKQFYRFYEILIEWNRLMNLTAITEFDDVLLKHFIDSLTICRVLELNGITDVIDVGTGAGFPGIPLKIMFPHLRLTLLDSLNKRIKFLDEVVGELGLEDVEAVHGRAEDYAKQKNYRESYDLCVSRAVANLSTLSEYCLPYVKIGGFFVSYKSGKVDEEIQSAKKALQILGGEVDNIEKFYLGQTDISRSLLLIRKSDHTPARYPRKSGLPAKEPII